MFFSAEQAGGFRGCTHDELAYLSAQRFCRSFSAGNGDQLHTLYSDSAACRRVGRTHAQEKSPDTDGSGAFSAGHADSGSVPGQGAGAVYAAVHHFCGFHAGSLPQPGHQRGTAQAFEGRGI